MKAKPPQKVHKNAVRRWVLYSVTKRGWIRIEDAKDDQWGCMTGTTSNLSKALLFHGESEARHSECARNWHNGPLEVQAVKVLITAELVVGPR